MQAWKTELRGSAQVHRAADRTTQQFHPARKVTKKQSAVPEIVSHRTKQAIFLTQSARRSTSNGTVINNFRLERLGKRHRRREFHTLRGSASCPHRTGKASVFQSLLNKIEWKFDISENTSFLAWRNSWWWLIRVCFVCWYTIQENDMSFLTIADEK
jgi:hypothetical protein